MATRISIVTYSIAQPKVPTPHVETQEDATVMQQTRTSLDVAESVADIVSRPSTPPARVPAYVGRTTPDPQDELELDCLAVEDSIEITLSADSWLRGETNAYLKTDEAKRFKQLMVSGIEVKKWPFHGGSIRKSQIRILHTDKAMTYLALSKSKSGKAKKMIFPFVDIVATPKGETHLKLSCRNGNRTITMASKRSRDLLVKFIKNVNGSSSSLQLQLEPSDRSPLNFPNSSTQLEKLDSPTLSRAAIAPTPRNEVSDGSAQDAFDRV
jgi:hypothetical protein